MNVLLWIFQAVLALLFLSGGAYKAFAFDEVARQLTVLSRTGWGVLGVIEMVGGLLLIVPAATGWMPQLTPLAAALLTLESLALCGIYASHSLDLAATNPLLWSTVMALLMGFVAYGRYALSPVA
jgi:hypothetical protein